MLLNINPTFRASLMSKIDLKIIAGMKNKKNLDAVIEVILKELQDEKCKGCSYCYNQVRMELVEFQFCQKYIRQGHPMPLTKQLNYGSNKGKLVLESLRDYKANIAKIKARYCSDNRNNIDKSIIASLSRELERIDDDIQAYMINLLIDRVKIQ